MKRYAIVADDLTGSGDTGVQFTRAGFSSRVVFGGWEDADLSGIGALVVNTDSRARSRSDAYDAVKQSAAGLVRLGFSPAYKKVDSTLRGHLGTEIEAIMDVAGSRLAIVCPAFPANGRVVVGGYLLVDGIPVERTAAGRDPVTPVGESYIPALLSGETRRDVELVTYRDLSSGKDRLVEVFRNYLQENGAIVVCDASTEADLELIAAAGYAAAQDALFTGSAGLAAPLSRILARESGINPAEDATRTIGGKTDAPLLALVGSVNPAARNQVEMLQSESRWMKIPLTVEELLSEEPEWRSVRSRAASSYGTAVKERRGILVLSPGSPEDVDGAFRHASKRGMARDEATARIAERIADIGYALLETGGIGGVIATGGDTARAFLEKLGASGFDLIAEVAPGIPLGSIPNGRFGGLRIVTKAGGFGKPDALLAAARLLGNG